MNIKMLPNWCKKIGILIFLLGFFIVGYTGFLEGFQKGLNGNEIEPKKIESFLSDKMIHFFDVIAIIGMLIYLLSKEKIEDDYINKLRLESYQLTSFTGLAITILLYVFSKDITLTLDYFIILFLATYLIIFALKKRQY